MMRSCIDLRRNRRIFPSDGRVSLILTDGRFHGQPCPRCFPRQRDPAQPWYRQLNGYHWLVLIVATMAWSFDCLNQQIFNLARTPAMADLLGVSPDDPQVTYYGNLGTSMLLIGWATGGIIFGMMGDRIGTGQDLADHDPGLFALDWFVRAFANAVALYCLLRLSQGWAPGGFSRWPARWWRRACRTERGPRHSACCRPFRPSATSSAGLIWLLLVQAWSRHLIHRDWPWLFSVGIIPALLSIIVARRIREPEVWLKASGRMENRIEEGRLARRTAQRSPLGAACGRRPLSGGVRGRRTVGHRRVQQ